MLEFIAVEDARRIVLDALVPLPSEPCSLEAALGRTLAEPIVSRDDIPPFPNSAMDGFAVRVADLSALPATLRITEEIPAGVTPRRVVEPGSCARIMTGAPFPSGADAVVPVEWTERVGDVAVRVDRAPASGAYVRAAGEDVRRGDRVVEAGEVVTPPVVGLLATLGYARVTVHVRPRVAVIATGDELVDAGAELAPGQIRDSNGPALAAQVRDAGAEPLPPIRVRDSLESIREAVERSLAADVLVFSGGVSVGAYDLVKQVLDERGMTLHFWKVRQRPGKPLAFGLLEGKPVFGLPGNPVSSAICFEQYVRPGLAKLLGRRAVLRPRHPAVLEEALSKKGGLYHFVRGRSRVGSDGRLYVRDTGPQGSNLYTSVVRADCLIHLPEAVEDPPAGTRVEIERLAW